MGHSLEVEIAAPYQAMLEELEQLAGDEQIEMNLSSGVENLIEQSYQQLQQQKRAAESEETQLPEGIEAPQ